MYANKIIRILIFLGFTFICTAKHASGGSYVTIINGTPYNWTMIESYKNKVKGHIPKNPPGTQWDWDWPKVINSGKILLPILSRESCVAFFRWDGSKPVAFPDAKAEAHVSYRIEGTAKPHSVRIRADKKDGMVYADFFENLESLNNPVKSVIKLGSADAERYENYPGQLFVLAGSEGSFISSNPPVAWMQATLPTIGHRTLREIALPASHNSGMSEVTCERGGNEHIDQTQSLNIYEQLKAGVRILDIRPSFWENYSIQKMAQLSVWVPWLAPWFTNIHIEDAWKDRGPQVRCGNLRPNQLNIWIGATGMDMKNVVEQINKFNKEYPGELILINVQFFDWLFEQEAMKLHRLTYFLQKIEHRQELWLPDSGPGSDLGTYHLESFIGGGKSSVVVLMPEWWFSLYEQTGCVDSDGIIYNEDTNDWSFWWPHDPEYWTGRPVEKIIKPGENPYPFNVSSVLRRNETRVVMPDAYKKNGVITTDEENKRYVPGKHFVGFFEHRRFQWHNEYADKHDIMEMSNLQSQALRAYRTTPYDEPHMVKFFTTQNRMDTWFLLRGPLWNNYWPYIQRHEFDLYQSVMGYGRKANARLYDWLWKWCTPASYPNGVQVDNFEDSSITALVMAINLWFGGKYEIFSGLNPGSGKSKKSEEFILAAMQAESDIIDRVIFKQTRDMEKQDNQSFWEFTHDKNTMIGASINPWKKMEGMAQFLWHRVAECVEDPRYGKICGGDD